MAAIDAAFGPETVGVRLCALTDLSDGADR